LRLISPYYLTVRAQGLTVPHLSSAMRSRGTAGYMSGMVGIPRVYREAYREVYIPYHTQGAYREVYIPYHTQDAYREVYIPHLVYLRVYILHLLYSGCTLPT